MIDSKLIVAFFLLYDSQNSNQKAVWDRDQLIANADSFFVFLFVYSKKTIRFTTLLPTNLGTTITNSKLGGSFYLCTLAHQNRE